jgi:hypothetical protein
MSTLEACALELFGGAPAFFDGFAEFGRLEIEDLGLLRVDLALFLELSGLDL